MARVKIEVDTEVWTTDRADSSDPWSRDSTGGRVSNVSATLTEDKPDKAGTGGWGSYVKEFEGLKAGDTVYVVVADYESGDTFGRSGGHYQILDAFASADEADALLEAANAYNDQGGSRSERISRGLSHNGVNYYVSWDGYFESLNSLDIWAVDVRSLPGTKAARRENYKRGR